MERKVMYGVLLKQIHDSLEKRINHALRAQDLTMAQFGVLVELCLMPEKQMPLKELERRLHVAQSTAAGIVARLEQKGLVRGIGSPHDRRVKVVCITPKGEKCFQCTDQDMQNVEEQLLSALSLQERDTLLQLLQRLHASIS